jgi:4'-phosphopantetheinyl transferase
MSPVFDQPSMTLATYLNPNRRSSDIHVWVAELSSLSSSGVHECLSESERTRANRFRFEKDRARFIACRSFLRKILVTYLEVQSAKIQFVNDTYRKPALDPTAHPTSLKFNVSHSRDIVVIAVSEGCDLGIDVEYIDYSFPTRRIATLLGSHSGLAPEMSKREFFEQWTRTEARLKCSGLGLYGLSYGSVSTNSRQTKNQTYLSETSALLTGLFVSSFSIGDNYVGAVASCLEAPQLRFVSSNGSGKNR